MPWPHFALRINESQHMDRDSASGLPNKGALPTDAGIAHAGNNSGSGTRLWPFIRRLQRPVRVIALFHTAALAAGHRAVHTAL